MWAHLWRNLRLSAARDEPEEGEFELVGIDRKPQAQTNKKTPRVGGRRVPLVFELKSDYSFLSPKVVAALGVLPSRASLRLRSWPAILALRLRITFLRFPSAAIFILQLCSTAGFYNNRDLFGKSKFCFQFHALVQLYRNRSSCG